LQKSAQKGYILFIAVFETTASQIINKPAFVMCDKTMGLAQSTTRRGVCIET